MLMLIKLILEGCDFLLLALKCLLENLDPSHDKPTHQWLAERVAGHVQTTQDDISLEDWFQNAPDR